MPSRGSAPKVHAEAATVRKHLLAAFADYDALAKRIRSLPCNSGGSQDRVQQAIFGRAVTFMQTNMVLLQVRFSLKLFLLFFFC